MEKMSVESNGRAWHASDVDTIISGRDQTPDLTHMMCCPCVNYSRTYSRLNAALKGRMDAVENPNRNFWTTECVQFALCIPFYSVMVGRLQGTIRAFYNITGKETEDWADGCFCPCATIARNEEEVVFRERNRRAKNLRVCDLEELSSADDPYKTQVPMFYGSPRATDSPKISSPPLSKSAVFNAHESETDVDPLTSISEKKKKRSATPGPFDKPNKVYMVPDNRKFNSSSFDSPEITPADEKYVMTAPLSPRPLMEYLGQKWYLVPADNKENDDPAQGKGNLQLNDYPKQDRDDKTHPLAFSDKDAFLTVPANVLAKGKHYPVQDLPRISIEKEKNEAAAVQPRVSLEKKKDQSVESPKTSLEKKKDQFVAAQPRSSLEKKKDQAVATPPTTSLDKGKHPVAQGHRLSEDKKQNEAPAANIHALEYDNQRYTSPIVIQHMLEQERYKLNQRDASNSQGEPSSQRAQGPYLMEGPMRPVIEHGKSRFTEHLLEDDRHYVASPTRSGSPHFLSADAMVSRIHAMGSPHYLEDEHLAQSAVIENIESPYTQDGLTTTNDEESSKSKGKEPVRVQPAKQKEEPSRGRTEFRKGFMGFIGRNEPKDPEFDAIELATQKVAAMSPSLELNLPDEEAEGTWAKGFWPGAFASSSQSAPVSHKIDDDLRVVTRPEPASAHGIDTDEKEKAQPEIVEAIKGRVSAVDNEKPGETDAKTEDKAGDKPTETTTNKSTDLTAIKSAEAAANKSAKATGSKIAKAASQFFGAGSK
ncbi:unnamed protein product [Clonostachys chloroleuca]|uniref:Uncharacterized protein n=1 Tax=Clonostachys chloroleuca TaxID=1926264 RepID=A0AA35PSH9_9HYPO|nr:unnamed protein product [Clonostachys chloroleuca]